MTHTSNPNGGVWRQADLWKPTALPESWISEFQAQWKTIVKPKVEGDWQDIQWQPLVFTYMYTLLYTCICILHIHNSLHTSWQWIPRVAGPSLCQVHTAHQGWQNKWPRPGLWTSKDLADPLSPTRFCQYFFTTWTEWLKMTPTPGLEQARQGGADDTGLQSKLALSVGVSHIYCCMQKWKGIGDQYFHLV